MSNFWVNNLSFILSWITIFISILCGLYLIISHNWLKNRSKIFQISFIGSLITLIITSINLIIPANLEKANLEVSSNKYLGLDYSFYIDSTTKLIAFLVSLVGFIVITVASIYFKEAKYSVRFFGVVQVFIGAMLGLVYCENLLLGFIFWELMGITSFLLIGFDNHREKAILAARKAFYYTKFGDVFFLLALILLYAKFGHLSIVDIKITSNNLGNSQEIIDTLVISGVFISFAALVKSAQGLFMGWLLDAMEGPAPVSALLHAATMVAAGVILIGRLSPLWYDLNLSQPLIFIGGVAALTSILAALMAIYSDELKRLLAASTISQLSIMYVGLAVNALTGSWWLLGAHASYKAGLFLIVGLLTVSLGISTVSSLKSAVITDQHKWLMLSLGLGGLALSGLPLMTGFYAKESITTSVLEYFIKVLSSKAITEATVWIIIYLLVILSTVLTAIYSVRLIKLALPVFQSSNLKPFAITRISNLPLILISLGLICSFVLALIKFTLWIPSNIAATISFLIGLVATLGGFYIGFNYTSLTPPEPNIIRNNYYFDHFINRIFLEPLQELAYLCKSFDEKIVDGIVKLVSSIYLKISKYLGYLDEKVLDGLVRTVAYSYGVITLISNFIDRFVIDGFVKQFCATWDRLHRYIKLPQNGQVQAYLLAIMITIVTFALVNLPKMIETISEILKIQRKMVGGS